MNGLTKGGQVSEVRTPRRECLTLHAGGAPLPGFESSSSSPSHCIVAENSFSHGSHVGVGMRMGVGEQSVIFFSFPFSSMTWILSFFVNGLDSLPSTQPIPSVPSPWDNKDKKGDKIRARKKKTERPAPAASQATQYSNRTLQRSIHHWQHAWAGLAASGSPDHTVPFFACLAASSLVCRPFGLQSNAVSLARLLGPKLLAHARSFPECLLTQVMKCKCGMLCDNGISDQSLFSPSFNIGGALHSINKRKVD
ncbi:hypothetical protein B0T24DRAFT_617147 [Lasiosphaeria ovina]|uniref:Uncharacterized protein n=1 Tax=Lasiosphaeria ovina TaxID=92902 RepID=A0AAE0KFI9_9PEZI|nr:hypothetical protein B0T24DRAFT_617147 [Lasiosphaeria ovina]